MQGKITRRAFNSMLLALPFSAWAQQAKKVPRIGYLTGRDRVSDADRSDAILRALRQFGYVDGQNIDIEYRYADGKRERFREIVAQLVGLNVDVLLIVSGDAMVQAAMSVTKTIPIIMTGGGSDPVESGFIQSLAHPGGNVTGITSLTRDLSGKRLELLKEVLPKLSRVAVLYASTNRSSVTEVDEDLPPAVQALQLTVRKWDVKTAADFNQVFAAIGKQRPDGLFVSPGALINTNQKRIAEFAKETKLPSVFGRREAIDEGGLLYYGADLSDSYRQVAWYTDKILKGAKPADLPVQQPIKFELVINLKTAKQLGITIPQWTLMKATKVIK